MPATPSTSGVGFSMKIDGRERLKENGRRFTRALLEQLADAVLATALNVQADAKETIVGMQPPAYDTGQLLESILVETSPAGLVARVTAGAPHAPYIEFGTRPHYPPIAPLKAWCKRHDIPESVAYRIQKKIGQRGTPERPYMRPAYQANLRTLNQEIKERYPQATKAIGPK